MPWLTRGDRCYYYRSIRTAKGPRNVYVGTGPAAAAVAEADELRRRERQRVHEELGAIQAKIEETLVAVVELNENLELLTRSALLAAGYHQHARSEWRRRRHAKHKTEDG